jgi:hypothetical protein
MPPEDYRTGILWHFKGSFNLIFPYRNKSFEGVINMGYVPERDYIFTHKRFAYPFEIRDASDLDGQTLFAGGLMPSHDLLPHFRRDVTLQLVHRGMDAFAAAQLGHRDLATDAFHQDADLVFGTETPARGLLGFADQTAGGFCRAGCALRWDLRIDFVVHDHPSPASVAGRVRLPALASLAAAV